MENTKPSSSKAAIKWGIIYVITSIVITYAFQFLNIDPNSPAKYLGYIPLIAFMLLAQKEHKDQLGGYLTFGQGFSTGFIYAIFSGVLLAIFMYIYWTFLSPQMLQQILDATRDKLTAQGTLSADQIDTQMGFMNKYGVIIFVAGILIGTAIIGAIIALIGAAIFKKERPPFDIEESNSYTDPTV